MEMDENNNYLDGNCDEKISKELNKKIYNTIKEKIKNYDDINKKENKLKNKKEIKYNKIKIIGKGTFGVVYKVNDTENKNKIYALKKVLQEPQFKNREHEIIKLIDHPNCIKLYDSFYTENKVTKYKEVYLNLIMNYIPDSLTNIIDYYYKNKKPFPNTLAKIYFYQLLRGWGYLHRKGICHRDLKTSNILINIKNHKLEYCDFGSAKILENDVKSLNYICNRYYRAPELILETKKYGCEIDVWSLGCIMAEVFIGKPIFIGTSTKNQLIKIIKILGSPSKEDIKAMNLESTIKFKKINELGLKSKLPDVDDLAVDLISKLLVYNPNKRPDPFKLLEHPYFDELRKRQISINSTLIVDIFNFTNEEKNKYKDFMNKLIPKWYNKKKEN